VAVKTVSEPKVAEKFAFVPSENGQCMTAEELFRRPLDVMAKELSPGHMDTVAYLQHLASIQKKLGRYEDTAQSNRIVLSGRRRILATNPNHPARLESLECLATALQGLGKYSTAESIHKLLIKRKKHSSSSAEPGGIKEVAETGRHRAGPSRHIYECQ